jgi:hypothetical protein
VPRVAIGSDTGYIESVIKTSQFSADGKDEIMLAVSADKVLSEDEFEDVANAMDSV